MNENIFFKFIGNKWFILLLAVAMCFALPVTYNNMVVIYEAGQMAKYWWVPVIFIMNLLAAIMAFFKFVSAFTKKKEEVKNW
jgi:hypothetical protein